MKKNKFRSWINAPEDKGETNTEKSKTMPDMHQDPRQVIENHVRGINPITGAILDKQHYYGENILPYQKDLTFEELRLRRLALNQQVNGLQKQATEEPTQDDVDTGGTPEPNE